jgi:hypothetical protein
MPFRKRGPDGGTFERTDLECEQRDIDQLGGVVCEHHDSASGKKLYELLCNPNGFTPSIPKPNLKFRPSTSKSGQVEAMCCQAGVSAGILHFPS